MPWQRSAFNEVNDWAPKYNNASMAKYNTMVSIATNFTNSIKIFFFNNDNGKAYSNTMVNTAFKAT